MFWSTFPFSEYFNNLRGPAITMSQFCFFSLRLFFLFFGWVKQSLFSYLLRLSTSHFHSLFYKKIHSTLCFLGSYMYVSAMEYGRRARLLAFKVRQTFEVLIISSKRNSIATHINARFGRWCKVYEIRKLRLSSESSIGSRIDYYYCPFQ